MLSIIIPIYNVEAYLPQCLESMNILRKATDVEFILVDDGSPDNCGKICDEYATQHEDVKVIHQKNGGLSAARNAGINAAQGDYLWFIDSDDFLNTDALKVVKALKEQKADIFFFGTKLCDENGTVSGEIGRGLQTGNYSAIDIFRAFRFPFSGVQFSVFGRSVFQDVRFKEGIVSEDWQLILRALVKAEICFVVDANPYCYRIRTSGSITHSAKTFRYVRDSVDIAQDFYDCLNDKNILPQNKYILYAGICSMLVGVRRLITDEIEDKGDKKQSLDYFAQKTFWKEALCKGGNWKQWMQYYVLRLLTIF